MTRDASLIYQAKEEFSICLNGHKLIINSGVTIINATAEFNICDCYFFIEMSSKYEV